MAQFFLFCSFRKIVICPRANPNLSAKPTPPVFAVLIALQSPLLSPSNSSSLRTPPMSVDARLRPGPAFIWLKSFASPPLNPRSNLFIIFVMYFPSFQVHVVIASAVLFRIPVCGIFFFFPGVIRDSVIDPSLPRLWKPPLHLPGVRGAYVLVQCLRRYFF